MINVGDIYFVGEKVKRRGKSEYGSHVLHSRQRVKWITLRMAIDGASMARKLSRIVHFLGLHLPFTLNYNRLYIAKFLIPLVAVASFSRIKC